MIIFRITFVIFLLFFSGCNKNATMEKTLIVRFYNENDVPLELEMNGIKKEVLPNNFQAFEINSDIKTLTFKAKIKYYENDSLPYMETLIYRFVKVEDLKKDRVLEVKKKIKDKSEKISHEDYIKLINEPFDITAFDSVIVLY